MTRREDDDKIIELIFIDRLVNFAGGGDIPAINNIRLNYHRQEAADVLETLRARDASGEPRTPNDPAYPRKEAEKIAVEAIFSATARFCPCRTWRSTLFADSPG